MINLSIEDPANPTCISLVEALWKDLGQLYGDIGPCKFKPSDVTGEGCVFVVAWMDGQPVGCGGVRPLEPGVAELKRMYVVPTVRRQGIAQQLLTKLEALAFEIGYTFLRLETGTPQVAAMHLYEKAGYHSIPCYGEYKFDPRSVCFEKSLC